MTNVILHNLMSLLCHDGALKRPVGCRLIDASPLGVVWLGVKRTCVLRLCPGGGGDTGALGATTGPSFTASFVSAIVPPGWHQANVGGRPEQAGRQVAHDPQQTAETQRPGPLLDGDGTVEPVLFCT